MELDIYWPVMLTVPSVELDIYWPVMVSVPSVKLGIYWPVMVTVPSITGQYISSSTLGTLTITGQ